MFCSFNQFSPKSVFKYFPKKTHFVIFSDSHQEAYSVLADIFLNSGMMFTHYTEHTYIEDFKLMKRCKSFIIANSSFSAMAALLGEHPEKKVIAPSKWFGKAADPEQWETKDIYHKDWIVI